MDIKEEKIIADEVDNNKWYALYTFPRCEKKVFKRLTEKNIETYLPLKKSLRVWSDRKKWVEMPIIASYIFVRTNKKYFFDIVKTDGVSRFVTLNRKVIFIPDIQIEAMKKAISNDLILGIEPALLKKGKEITIQGGLFKGVTGVIENIKQKKVLYLRITGIGYVLKIDLKDAE